MTENKYSWLDEVFDNLFYNTGFSPNAAQQFEPYIVLAKQIIINHIEAKEARVKTEGINSISQYLKKPTYKEEGEA